MAHVHDNKVNKTAECNLIHDTINHPKRNKDLNINCYLIIHGCMNNRKSKAKFKKNLILLDSICSSTIVMVRLVKKLKPNNNSVMQWYIQAGNITPNLKVKVYLTLLTLSATNAMTWKYHVDHSPKGRYDMLFGRGILIYLRLDLNFSDHVIKATDGHLKGSKTPMVDLGTYEFKDLNTGKLHLKNHFIMLTSKNYISRNMYVLPLNDYV